MGVDGEPPPTCVLARSDAALIVAAEGAVHEVLGWEPEELIGSPSTAFIHPEDQASAVAAWFDMLALPGVTRSWQGRYRSSDGSWRWVESSNCNLLDDVDNPRVVSTIVRITVDEVNIAEELRARKQVLNRLADALPVGLFQIDTGHNIIFTNDRLHAIIASPPAATVAAQFGAVSAKDWERFEAGLDDVMSDRPVDDLEIRFDIAAPVGEMTVRVCVVSLRPLTDDTGTVSGAIGCLSDVTDRVRMRRELQLRANTDALTGSLNRAAILELLDLRLGEVSSPGPGLAVIYIDLDDFKHVNDRFGHAAGDDALVATVRRIRGAIRQNDRVGRLGGDEFLVVCPEVIDDGAADELTDRVRVALNPLDVAGATATRVRATVGGSWTGSPLSADALIARADEAMYAAKRARRGHRERVAR